MSAPGCADVELVLARGGGLAGEPALTAHVAGCDACRVLSAAVATEPDPELPEVAGDAYLLGAEVARGGMGRILLARDLRIGRELAVKELVTRSPSLAARFEREARLTARLQHPGIVPIYEIGRWSDGTPFYAMRMVKGVTLREAIAGAVTPAARLALLPRVLAACEAVAFAHGQRVIHRDLSPSNVMVGEHGETVVIDWGLAKELDTADEPAALPAGGDDGVSGYRTEGLTVDGAVFGTAGFMAPEQARGEPVDARADVYALGAILHQVLGGGGTDVPRDLASVVDKAMAAAAAARYRDAGELAHELRHFRDGRMVAAHSYSPRERVTRWLRRHPVLVVAALVASLAAAVAVFGIVRQRDRAVAAEQLARRQRATTETALSVLYERESQARLDRGDLWGGGAYIAEAMRLGRHGPRTRTLLRRALHGLDAVAFAVPRSPGAGAILQLRWSRDDRQLLVVSQHRLRFLDGAAGGERVAIDRPADQVAWPLWEATFSPDGRRVLAVDRMRQTGGLWDTTSGAVVRRWADDHDGLHFLGDHQLVEVAVEVGDDDDDDDDDPVVELWKRHDTATGAGGAEGVALGDLEASEHWIVDEQDAHVDVLDRATTALVAHLDAGGPLIGSGVSDDGAWLVTCRKDGEVALWQVAGAVRIATRTLPAAADCMVSSGGGHVATVGDGGRVTVWSIAAGTVAEAELGVGVDAHDVALAANGLVVVSRMGAVDICHLPAEPCIAHLDGAGDPILSHDGRRLAVSRPDDGLAVYDLARLGPRARWSAAAHGVDQILATSGDGRLVLGRAGDAPVVWDVEGGQRTLPALRMPAALATGGDRLAAWSGDAIVVVDLASGAVVQRFAGVAAAPRTLRLTPDGRHLLAVTADRRMQMWRLDTGAVLLDVPGVLDAGMNDRATGVVACHDGAPAQIFRLDGAAPIDPVPIDPDWPDPATEPAVTCVRVDGLYRERLALVRDQAGTQHVIDWTGDNLVSLGELAAVEPHGVRGVVLHGREVSWEDFGLQAHQGVRSDEFPGEAWAMATAKTQSFVADRNGPVRRAAISPDGWIIATERGLWTPDGALVWPFPPAAFAAPLAELRFTASGDGLIAVDERGELTVWDMGDAPVDGAGELVPRFSERSGLRVDASGALVPLHPPSDVD